LTGGYMKTTGLLSLVTNDIQPITPLPLGCVNKLPEDTLSNWITPLFNYEAFADKPTEFLDIMCTNCRVIYQKHFADPCLSTYAVTGDLCLSFAGTFHLTYFGYGIFVLTTGPFGTTNIIAIVQSECRFVDMSLALIEKTNWTFVTVNETNNYTLDKLTPGFRIQNVIIPASATEGLNIFKSKDDNKIITCCFIPFTKNSFYLKQGYENVVALLFDVNQVIFTWKEFPDGETYTGVDMYHLSSVKSAISIALQKMQSQTRIDMNFKASIDYLQDQLNSLNLTVDTEYIEKLLNTTLLEIQTAADAVVTAANDIKVIDHSNDCTILDVVSATLNNIKKRLSTIVEN